MEKYVKRLMDCFNGSFINHLNELILVPKTNLYIGLNYIDSELELRVKLIEYCSRDAHKGCPYQQEKRNREYRAQVRESLNSFFCTNLNEEDFEKLYQDFGNGVDHIGCLDYVSNNLSRCMEQSSSHIENEILKKQLEIVVELAFDDDLTIAIQDVIKKDKSLSKQLEDAGFDYDRVIDITVVGFVLRYLAKKELEEK